MVAAMLRNHKRILICLNVVLVLAIAGCVYYALTPIDVSADSPAAAAGKISKPTKQQASQRKPKKNYDSIRIMNLRQPLVEIAPPEIPFAPVAAPSSLNLQLLGTVVESGHMYGLFRRSDGKDKLAGPGKKIDKAEVVSITEESATLKYNGQMVVLKVVKQPPPSAPVNVPVNSRNTRSVSSRRRTPTPKIPTPRTPNP